MDITLAFALPSIPAGDLANLLFFSAIRDFLLADDGLITRWSTGLAERLSVLIGMIALPLLTTWVLLHGYRIISGRSRDSLMAFVVDGARAGLIVFVATAASLGNPWLASRITELDQTISVLVTGGNDMDKQISDSLAFMQLALSSIDVLPTGGDPAVASAKERSLWFAGLGTAGPAVIGGTLLLLLQIVMRFLTAMAPLAVMCLLFEQTRQIFQRWLQYCVGALFRLAITAVMTSIALKMVCAVAGAFWVSKLLNAVVRKLSSGVVDLQMTEGVSSMALQQGGLGLIMGLLIITVPMMAAEFFMGTLGHFSHYSMFGGMSGSMSMPGPLGQPPGTYQVPTQTGQARTGPAQGADAQPEIQRTTVHRPDRADAVSRDVIRRATPSSESSGDHRTDLRRPDPPPERA